MPQYDLYHQAVKQALIKDGWLITDEPLFMEYKELRLYADLSAEKPLIAEKGSQKIVVEVKTFNGPSPITELEKAIGQYLLYAMALKHLYPDRKLYLAITQRAYQAIFTRPAAQQVVNEQHISLLVFMPQTEEIILWTS